jgi:UDP-glucose 4-epimerase
MTIATVSAPIGSVLITGAAGFIGGSLAAHFASLGVRVFVDVQPGDAGSTRRWPLGDAALLRATGGAVPDAIVHAAGSGTVAKVAAQPVLELPANLAAWLAVLQFAQAHAPRARVVLLSSAALYGNAPPEPQRETDARAPVSLYGVAKAQAEQLAAYYAEQHGLAATAVRLFSVYGPGLRKQLLWDAMNKLVADHSAPARFFGTGRERRDWIHIDDVCRFMVALLARAPAAPFSVYNCAGSPATTGEVLAVLAREARSAAPEFSGEVRAGDPASLVADCRKAERDLAWRATVPWQQGAAAYAAWFLAAKGAA